MIESNSADLNKELSVCLTVKEAAKMCGVCENTFRVLVNRYDFPKIRLSRRILIPRQAFLEYINGKAVISKNHNGVKETIHGSSSRMDKHS